MLAFFLANCSGFRNTVKISHTNFGDEIDQSQNLIFTFNKDLAPDSSLVKWDTTQYIVFTPAVKGKFKWTGKDELTFSPVEPFAPSTDYKAQLSKNITAGSKQKWAIDKKNTVLFHTPYLKLQNTQTYWALSSRHPGKVEVRINLVFNYKVKPTDIAPLLHLTLKGENTPFEINTTETASTITIAIPFVEQENKEDATPYRITIDKGFHCPGSSWISREPMGLSSEIPPKEKLMVMEMATSFADGSGVINVRLNQPIVDENLKALVTIKNNSIDYTVETFDGGIIIKGGFQPNITYNVVLSAKLKGIFGSSLNQDYSQYVSFGQMAPALVFQSSKSIYLTAAGAKNIALNLSGIQKLKVSVIRIYENNILSFVRSGQSYGYDYDEETDEGDRYRYYDYDNYGDKVGEKILETKSMARTGNAYLLHLDLEDMGYNSSFKGIYLLKLEDVERQWLQASKFISLSDIGLIVKRSGDDILVFANSIKTTDAIGDAKIEFISTNNQTVGSVRTNSNGFAKLENLKVRKPFVIGMVTVRSGQDFNFMILDRSEVETSRFDVGGKKINEANYDCFIYSNRDIYRPGDTMHFNTIIRSLDWQTLRDIPIKIKLLSPNGKEYKSTKETLDAQGSAELSFTLPSSVMTGLYTVEVYTGNDVLLNFYKVSVEEFMPDRIKVTTTLNKTEAKPGDSIAASINAVNLFGPPAANRNYEATMNMKRRSFYSKKFNTYNFNIHADDNISINTVTREGKTNEKGEARESFPIPDLDDLGILDGNILTTVFDESGRPVNRLANFSVVTQNVFFGIKKLDRWVNTRHPVSVPLIALDKSGGAIITTAQIQVIRYNWETVLQRSGGSYYYNSQKKEQVLLNQLITIPAGGTVFNYNPMVSGDYEVRIMRPEAVNYVSEEFWAYGWNDTQNTSFEVSNEGEVDITLDKGKYGLGDKANLLFSTPFEGKILVTVERDKVFEYYYLKTEKKAASLSITIEEEYLPNVYVTATAIRELNDNSLPLTVARGFVPLLVEKPSNKIPVTITAPEKSRSKTKQTILVKSTPNAEVTIGVVDEGILQLKDFKTPDAYNYFYAKRALEVNDYDLYPFVFPEIPNRSSMGGDMAEMSKRVNPVTAKRVNLVSFWSGVLKTNNNGEASFTISIPSFSGALRVMAVTYKDKTFGSSEKTIKVADPIVISTSLPRFITPGDTISVPVTITNTTSKEAGIASVISISGPLQPVGNTKISAVLKPNAEQQVLFKLVAKREVGAGSVTITVNGLNENFTDKTEIAVRPSSPLQKRTDAGVIAGGATVSLNLKADFLPGTAKAKLIISRSPLIQFSKNLSYLIQYPYGCVEQTVSTAFPQIYFADIAKSLGQGNTPIQYNPNYNVQEAVNKLESMQMSNGALSYWQGGDYESWWGSAYAAHFLLEAKRAGFDVNQRTLDKLFGYLQYKIKSYETETYWYYDGNKVVSRTIAKKEILYSMYVLALAGRFDYTSMNYYKGNLQTLALDCRYLLASTFALAGNNINYASVLPKGYEGEYSIRSFYGSFYSGIRDEALALNALLEADPNNPQIGLMAKHLSEMLKKETWLSTQECAFSFLALGKMARRAEQGNATATVSVNGNTIANFDGKNLTVSAGIFNQQVQVKSNGSGNLYYFWEMEGISPRGDYKKEDKFMKVRKSFLDRYGNPLNRSSFTQNELIVVKLTVESTDYGRNIENVAITDMLPAGFEIENPRVGSSPELNWIKDNATPDYLDIRDDRINFFATVTWKPQSFYYVVRAVSKGKFVMGPVSADAMYNSEYHSINGAGTIGVK